jgi:hypothetical protein
MLTLGTLTPGTLPRLTHERYLILSLILEDGGRITGEDLRRKMAKRGWTPTQPGFSQVMNRAEKAKFVLSEYAPKIVHGAVKRQRVYSITKLGIVARAESLKFYAP